MPRTSNRRGGKRGREDPICPPAPASHCAVLVPSFPTKGPGICQEPGAMGKGRRQSGSHCGEHHRNLWLLPRPLPREKGGILAPDPQDLSCSMGPGTASQDRQHESTWGLQVTLRSPSCRTSDHSLPLLPSARGTLSMVTPCGCPWQLCLGPGGEGAAVRNEKRGPGRCPALF